MHVMRKLNKLSVHESVEDIGGLWINVCKIRIKRIVVFLTLYGNVRP